MWKVGTNDACQHRHQKDHSHHEDSDSGPPIITAMNKANTRCTGARTHMRSIIWNAFCTLVTSVVMRVTRPAVENLSMLEKE